MAFVLLDDQWYTHPKWRTAPGDSIALWAAALAWCNDHDDTHEGRIPTHTLGGLLGGVRNVKRTVADLVERGALVLDGDCHLIHDYADRQRLDKRKAKVAEVSAKRAAAGRKGAESRWQTDGKPMANGMANGWPDDRQPTTDTQQPSDYISDDDESLTTGRPSSSSDLRRYEHAIAKVIAARQGRTEARYVAGIARNLHDERGGELVVMHVTGVSVEQAVRQLEQPPSIPHPSTQAPRRRNDPQCPDCEGSGAYELEPGAGFVVCDCVEPDQIATVHQLRSEA